MSLDTLPIKVYLASDVQERIKRFKFIFRHMGESQCVDKRTFVSALNHCFRGIQLVSIERSGRVIPFWLQDEKPFMPKEPQLTQEQLQRIKQDIKKEGVRVK